MLPECQAWRQVAQANREWEAECRQAAGPLAGHLNSWQVAHDMEAIRKAIGEGGLTYYGHSYGSVYGQAYAEPFPAKVHRMVLDSAPSHTERSLLHVTAPSAKIIRDKFRPRVPGGETPPARPSMPSCIWTEPDTDSQVIIAKHATYR